jgi:hypothetical protein
MKGASQSLTTLNCPNYQSYPNASYRGVIGVIGLRDNCQARNGLMRGHGDRSTLSWDSGERGRVHSPSTTIRAAPPESDRFPRRA